MRVRWTKDAAADLERICDYIAESRPESAQPVAKTIGEGVGTLELFPNPRSVFWFLGEAGQRQAFEGAGSGNSLRPDGGTGTTCRC